MTDMSHMEADIARFNAVRFSKSPDKLNAGLAYLSSSLHTLNDLNGHIPLEVSKMEETLARNSNNNALCGLFHGWAEIDERYRRLDGNPTSQYVYDRLIEDLKKIITAAGMRMFVVFGVVVCSWDRVESVSYNVVFSEGKPLRVVREST